MKRLAVLFCITISYGKIINMPDLVGQDLKHVASKVSKEYTRSNDIVYNVWALDLKPEDWDSVGLRKISGEELWEVSEYVGPLIEEYDSRPRTSTRVKKDDPGKPYSPWTVIPSNETKMSLDEIKQDIFKLINKFDMHTKGDTVPNLEDNNECSSSIYFFDGYTWLVMESGEKQFYYFIPPPSPLPDWFYEDYLNSISNEQQKYLKLPDNIKNEFYLALLRLLQIILSHPL